MIIRFGQREYVSGVVFGKPLLLGYTGPWDTLLHKYLQGLASLRQYSCSQFRISLVGNVVGTHVGPGAIAVAFFAAE
jgi:hypothetical protein